MSILRTTGFKVGVALIAALVIATAVVNGTGMFKNKDIPVTVVFPDASPLIPGNLVRMSGVEVGKIESVDLRNGQAAVRMRLDPSVLPLHKDASAKIRPVTLLGERFIDLNRGSDGSPVMVDPRVIPAQHTTRAVDLDEVLNSLNQPTSASLAALVTTLGEGTGGQGQNVDGAVKALAPAMQNTQQLGNVLQQQNAVLGQLVDRASPVAQALAARNGGNLDQAVEQGKNMLAAVAAQRQAMKDSLGQLPGTLQEARHVLDEAAGTAEAGTPALRDIRPTTDNLPQISRELNQFADTANPAMASLPPVLDKGKTLLDQAAPAVRDLRPGADALPKESRSANRLVGDLTPAMGTAMDFIRGWAMSTNGRDALGNYFRAFVVTTPQGVLQIPGVGTGPPGAPSPAPTPQLPIPGVPGVPPPLPGLPSVPGVPILPPPGAPPGGNDSATGLDQKQESGLVGQLLGGR